MKWRNEERIELLGAEIDTDPASRVASEGERDCAFRARYCSERVRFRLCAARVTDRVARLVVDRLADALLDSDPEGDEPVPQQPGPLPRTGPAGSSASPVEPNKTADLMLDVLRDVAIARVRTVLPAFGREGLNRWVMETGYGLVPAPHADTADLLYVYAASVPNAG